MSRDWEGDLEANEAERWKLKCAHKKCDFLVHASPEFGGFCCRMCHASGASGESCHGKSCQGKVADFFARRAFPQSPAQPLGIIKIRNQQQHDQAEVELPEGNGMLEACKIHVVCLSAWVYAIRGHDPNHRSLQNAANMMQEALGMTGTPAEIERKQLHLTCLDDCWHAELRDTLLTKFGGDQCFELATVIVGERRGLCGVGIATTQKARKRLADLALALAIAQGESLPMPSRSFQMRMHELVDDTTLRVISLRKPVPLLTPPKRKKGCLESEGPPESSRDVDDKREVNSFREAKSSRRSCIDQEVSLPPWRQVHPSVKNDDDYEEWSDGWNESEPEESCMQDQHPDCNASESQASGGTCEIDGKRIARTGRSWKSDSEDEGKAESSTESSCKSDTDDQSQADLEKVEFSDTLRPVAPTPKWKAKPSLPCPKRELLALFRTSDIGAAEMSRIQQIESLSSIADLARGAESEAEAKSWAKELGFVGRVPQIRFVQAWTTASKSVGKSMDSASSQSGAKVAGHPKQTARPVFAGQPQQPTRPPPSKDSAPSQPGAKVAGHPKQPARPPPPHLLKDLRRDVVMESPDPPPHARLEDNECDSFTAEVDDGKRMMEGVISDNAKEPYRTITIPNFVDCVWSLQDSIGATFTDGRTLAALIGQLKRLEVDPLTTPFLTIDVAAAKVQGRTHYFAYNHRRLWCMFNAGCPAIRARIVPGISGKFFDDLVSKARMGRKISDLRVRW